MRTTRRALEHWICLLLFCAGPSFGMVRMQLVQGRPIVFGVYVNGHGPYRFVVDTGANTNLIAAPLARKIGLEVTFQTAFASLSRESVALGSAGNEISLDSVRAMGQEFLLVDLDSSPVLSGDVQGLLGQSFLARFDYALDLQRKQLSFGEQNAPGTRSHFTMINGRPAVSTSLGHMVLDSGAASVVISGGQPSTTRGRVVDLQSAAGHQPAVLRSERLVIEGRTVWQGEAVALPGHLDPGVDGLLPVRFFKSIYVCNSGGYIIFH